MKILSLHEAGYFSYVDRFDLNDIYAGRSEIPVGIMLMFLISRDRSFTFRNASAQGKGDIGEPRNILLINEDTYREYFRNIRQLVKVFREKELYLWTVSGEYHGTEVEFTGVSHASAIDASYDKNKELNLIPFLMTIEENTFRYHNYDGDLVDAMQSRYGLSIKKTVLALSRLKKYPDIWEEFTEGMTQDPFRFPKDGAVSVEGHTAEELFRSTKLKELGAYNYLIYLREQPERALADLEKGLPNLK